MPPGTKNTLATTLLLPHFQLPYHPKKFDAIHLATSALMLLDILNAESSKYRGSLSIERTNPFIQNVNKRMNNIPDKLSSATELHKLKKS